MSVHLVTGVIGQDGIWLARLLLRAGHRVIGTTRTGSAGDRACYLAGVELRPWDVRDTAGFAGLLRADRVSAVHNLAAMTSVGASWDAADEVEQVNAVAVRGMLEVLAGLGEEAPRFVQASSSEIFGPAGTDGLIDANTPLDPVSPYAEAKARAHRAVLEFRDRGVPATNLILFGHSSPLHAARFVLPTLARQVAEVSLGSRDAVALRDPSIVRDWGSAPDFMRAFEAAADGPPGDYVIATGVAHSLADLGERALASVSAEAGVTASGAPGRPHDFGGQRGDASLAGRVLGWTAERTIDQELARMVAVETRRIRDGVAETEGYLDD